MINRRTFGRLSLSAAGLAVVAPALIANNTALRGSAPNEAKEPHAEPSPVSTIPDGQLRSEFLLDLVFEKGAANNVGSPGVNRVVVPVTSGAFEGPRLKGTVASPSGDWIVVRPDGSSLLDLRMVLQTDDGQEVLMTARGVAYVQSDGALYARIQPLFETGAAKYLWLNSVVAVGVYRPVPKNIAYRIHTIL